MRTTRIVTATVCCGAAVALGSTALGIASIGGGAARERVRAATLLDIRWRRRSQREWRHAGLGFFVGRPHLTVTSPEEGEREARECRLVEQ